MVPMVLLTSVAGSFAARVVAARLASEGLDVELRGAVDSPYALTVGALAQIDLWVPADQLDDARLVLLATEVDEAMALRPGRDDVLRTRRTWPAWVLGATVALAVAAPVLRWLAPR